MCADDLAVSCKANNRQEEARRGGLAGTGGKEPGISLRGSSGTAEPKPLKEKNFIKLLERKKMVPKLMTHEEVRKPCKSWTYILQSTHARTHMVHKEVQGGVSVLLGPCECRWDLALSQALWHQ